MEIFDERCKVKLLIIPAPQLLSIVAKTRRGAYFSHKESEHTCAEKNAAARTSADAHKI